MDRSKLNLPLQGFIDETRLYPCFAVFDGVLSHYGAVVRTETSMMDNTDQVRYRDFLIANGLDPEIATSIASKTTQADAKAFLARQSTKGSAEHGHSTEADTKAPASPIQTPKMDLVVPTLRDLVAMEQVGGPGSTGKRRGKPKSEVIDYRSKEMPAWVREVIEAHLAIQAEDAKSAGALGFMARALVIATMPYKDQKNPDGTPKDSFTRQNGDFKLRIVAGYEGGIPFGIYPRLLMSWVTTEAVRKQSPIIELGDSLRQFLRDVLDVRSTSGGKRGTSTRVAEQMRRLFGALITAQYPGSQTRRGFTLKNVVIADQYDEVDEEETALWTPQQKHEVGEWQSKVKLTENFFQECITNPIPIDLRAFKALRGSPLAMDIYTWLTYRMSYLQTTSKPITWESLMLQFGAGYGMSVIDNPPVFRQAVLDFKRNFLKALKLVQTVYPEAHMNYNDVGLILAPSPTHVQSLGADPQRKLF